MRPGPGLVVMALAFISGARRASTSSSSSSNSLTIPTILPTTTRTTAAAVAAAAATGTTATINTAPPAFAIGTTIPSAASSSAAATLPSSHDSEPSSSGRESSFNFNAGGGFSFLLPTLRRYDGSPGDAGGSPVVAAHNFDFYRRPAPAPDPDTALASSTRRARSLDEGRAGQGQGQGLEQGQGVGPGTESGALVPESSEATLLGEGNEEQGVPVQYASSRAFDEETETESDAEPDADVVADEDIFALVAEDDLLSEESFDRLIKLSEDAETEAAEEDDYNLAASLDLTQQQQEQPQRQTDKRSQQEHEQESEQEKQQQQHQHQHQKQQQQEEHQESESQQQDEQSRLVDESVLHAEHNENSREQELHESGKENSNNNKRETGEERSRENDAYASHLIAVAQRDGGNLPAPAVGKTTTSGAKADGEANAGAAGGSVAVPVDYTKSILGTASSLTRLNPWISACDLAQPGTTGTDLQGQCSAGTLPMAWVDEGPGPPICPRSCAEQQPMESDSDSGSGSAAHNKLKYYVNANTFNYKSPHMRLSRSSSSSSSNNNNNYKVMSRVRRERDWQGELEGQTELAMTTTEQQEQQPEEELEQEQEQEQEGDVEASTMSSATASSFSSSFDVEPTQLYSHLQAQEQLSASEQQQQQQRQQQHQQQQQQQQHQQQQQQQQQQQCLDYLGDAAETSPQHLCGLRSPGQLLDRLRHLRLRHCCERSVFSALHTLALNATLSDRGECVRLLSDLLDVDALANRITCELAEILFRFDCRQVYSLINQCDDCKEAYRRWVCSTLVPYFAEPQDVDAAPTQSASAASSASASGDDLASRMPTLKPAGKSKRAASGADGSSSSGSGSKHKSQKLISNNNKSNNGNNMNEPQINQQPDQEAEQEQEREQEKPSKQSVNTANVAQAFYNVVGMQTQSQSHSNNYKNNESRAEQEQEEELEEEEEVEAQFNNFISTANKADPSAKDPVISKLQKRSTRKAEFRKRRRIRPCLSVCQTVEQKCPYLLPADRAPALPTQYAGEPTFVCLDQNIPETGEQLKKSSYGPNDCCYSYCDGPASGICTICQEFAPPLGPGQQAASSNSSGPRVHNITLTLSSPPAEHARAASISLALRNVSQATAKAGGGEGELLQRLPYYAHHDSVYYYDVDEGSDMPPTAVSDGCAAVPAVTSRCEIPYFASGVAPTPPTQLLVWLSALLGLLSSCGAARQRCQRTRGGGATNARVDCAASCHELLAAELPPQGAKTRRRRRGGGAGVGDGDYVVGVGNENGNASANAFTASPAWAWAWAWPNSSRGKSKAPSSRSRVEVSCRLGYSEMRTMDMHVRVECSARHRDARNYRYFYYYNYNINDWWRRWKSSGAL